MAPAALLVHSDLQRSSEAVQTVPEPSRTGGPQLQEAARWTLKKDQEQVDGSLQVLWRFFIFRSGASWLKINLNRIICCIQTADQQNQNHREDGEELQTSDRLYVRDSVC